MGSDKAFLEINGKTFLQNAVEILTPVCEDRIKVVLNKEQSHFIEKLPEALPYIFDIFENRGPVGGIHAALADCETEFAFILAVDQPLVTSKIIEKLADRMLESDPDVVIPKHESEVLQQLCTVFRVKSSSSLLEQLLSTPSNSVSVLRFIEALKSIEFLHLDSSDELFENINEPKDYRRINH